MSLAQRAQQSKLANLKQKISAQEQSSARGQAPPHRAEYPTSPHVAPTVP